MGFEIFIQNNGNIVVSALTKREYLATSVNSTVLLDGQWHYITVLITPPKRPFSYSQINVLIDFSSRIAATLKMTAINEVIKCMRHVEDIYFLYLFGNLIYILYFSHLFIVQLELL